MPSARIRLAGEAAFLVLVAVGLGLARFDPPVIGAVMLVALALVALLERASARAAARGGTPEHQEVEPPAPAELAAVEPVQQAEPEPEPGTTPETAVSERSARALLASAAPPLPPVQRRKHRPRPFEPRAAPPPPPQAEPESEPGAEPAPVVAGPPREWNLWELQRAVRDAADDERREEWSALLIHLREFANADGDLPVGFDPLVRESFASVLTRPQEQAAAR